MIEFLLGAGAAAFVAVAWCWFKGKPQEKHSTLYWFSMIRPTAAYEPVDVVEEV